jgi:hypothetical protein
MFRGQQEVFRTQGDAYKWLINKFIELKPNLLEAESGKSVYNTGRGRRHFAKTRDALFIKSPYLIDRPGHCGLLDNGWFFILHINVNEKFKFLENLSEAAELKRGSDWEWHKTL